MNSYSTDHELWSGVVADDSHAFALLYERYWKKLYQTARYYLKDDAAAEEITHDVFVSLWEKRASSNIQNFRHYIQATARYHVYKYLKAAKVNCVEYLEQFPETPALQVYNIAPDKLGYEQLESQLAGLLKDLPRRCQEIFWLSRVNHLSNQEIADKLHISKRTVENQITTALKALRVAYPPFMLALMISRLL
ncbi:RNA polymerase sigma-70 factor [Chitinophaga agrisoli]|uniref:RNA polymerase sigma-70 factor n=1 Tax=Chitinophaga agrisoli TaxID=2607653 RepID=A0A5B2VVK3_9BACT|nr:RNA polymerase sigma-70 factor [Chitinophaga agrisoli]KAA2242598.1 RNA polymerase sigma-70 factor [Chitinophaga agrisoli]